MAVNTFSETTELGFGKLEERLAELIDLCRRLTDEKQSLQRRCELLLQERQSLIDQNEQARLRIEAMVARLKALEPSL